MYILETIKTGNQTIGKEIPKDVEGPQQQYLSSILDKYPNSRSDVTRF